MQAERRGIGQRALRVITNPLLINTLLSTFFGLLVGAIVMLVAGYNPIQAYAVLFTGVFGDVSSISWMIIRATPLIVTGLSITFAFKTGLFNIGAEGQFIVGVIAATLVGHFVELPAVLHIPLCLLAAAVAGGLYGGIAGLLKSKLGISEVLTTIMLNWIAFYFSNFLLSFRALTSMHLVDSVVIKDSASIALFKGLRNTPEGMQMIRDRTFLGNLIRTPVNAGIFIAIGLAIIVWFILKKTSLGYELKAVGFNSQAAEYGGINVGKRMFQSMMIAGALAGLAGAIHVMGNAKYFSKHAVTEGFGFDGMSVALIGGTTPLGTVLGGFLFSTLTYGGTKIQAILQAPTEIVSIVTGTIVLFIAMPKLIQIVKSLIVGRRKKKGEVHEHA